MGAFKVNSYKAASLEPLKYLWLALLPILLGSCGDAQTKTTAKTTEVTAKPAEEVYDYRDERYQDFYSRYMRKMGKDYLIIRSRNVQTELDLKEVPEEVHGKMIVYRVPEGQGDAPRNALKNSGDVLRYYNHDGEKYKLCEERHQVIGLLCMEKIEDPGRQDYYYLPDESKKIDFIDQSLYFFCIPSGEKKECILSNKKIEPYNIDVWTKFTDPKNFFYIMPFIEQHFFNATGEHIWQTLPKQK